MGAGRGGPGEGGSLIDSRPRDTVSLSSHRCPLAGLTKKEIGFADFDPFVFGQRPALQAGAEKCEGPLIGRGGTAPRARAPSRRSLRPAQFKGGCRADCLGCLFINPLAIWTIVGCLLLVMGCLFSMIGVSVDSFGGLGLGVSGCLSFYLGFR